MSTDAASFFTCWGVGLIVPDRTFPASDATFLEVCSFFGICIDFLMLDGDCRLVSVPVEEVRRGHTGGSVVALDLPRSGVLRRHLMVAA